ncbi:MAG TPA: hypothetical protein VJ505_08250 [Holophagaceae bacterium]|nr:hypothetical protein [Holophagaceae bacterium]
MRAFLAVLALVAAPRQEPPKAPARLSQTGLYDAAGKVARGNLAYAPQYPLWSDGAAKTRWLQLPEGSRIDATNEDGWRFPVGTKVWKEFAFGGRKVETRLIWRTTEKDWVFASYRWNEAQTDAELVPVKGLADVAEIAPGKRHSIPSLADCKACHDNAGTELLGLTALQLSPDRDPGAIHAEPLAADMVTLDHLLAKGLLQGARKDLATRPPRLPGNAQVRPLLGYFAANCGTCHRADAPLPYLTLDLHPTFKATALEMEPAHQTALDQRGQYLIPGDRGEGSYLLASGHPEVSSVIHRMASRDPDVQMPPLGTVLADEAALQALRAWIRNRPAPAVPPAH